MELTIRNYPHGLDEEILPDDFEVEKERADDLEEDLNAEIAEENAIYVDSYAEANYFAACYKYALGESPDNLKPLLAKALENWFLAVRFGIVMDVYEFIRLLALARAVGNREIAEALAKTKRDRYTDPDVEAEEIVFAVAELLAAFIRRDDEAVALVLAENNPATIDEKKIYRYDRMIYFPLLEMMNAIHQGDSAKFAAALEKRQKQFVDFFKRSTEKNDPEALIDMPGLAVAVIARRRDLKFTDSSVYRPSGL